jgi:hypothetical protein
LNENYITHPFFFIFKFNRHWPGELRPGFYKRYAVHSLKIKAAERGSASNYFKKRQHCKDIQDEGFKILFKVFHHHQFLFQQG